MTTEQINVTFKWTVLLVLILLLGLLGWTIIRGDVQEKNSFGLHDILGGLLVLIATYGNNMFNPRTNGRPPKDKTPAVVVVPTAPPPAIPPIAPTGGVKK